MGSAASSCFSLQFKLANTPEDLYCSWRGMLPMPASVFSFREEEGWQKIAPNNCWGMCPEYLYLYIFNCKLDKTIVHTVKRQNNGVDHSSLELRNMCSSFLLICKYLLVGNIFSSLVITDMPDVAISECVNWRRSHILSMCTCGEHTHF